MARERSVRRHAAYVAATGLVGVAGAAFAIAFRLALHHGLTLLLGTDHVLDGFRRLPFVSRAALPAVGGLCAGLVTQLTARGASGHGVGAILEAVTLGRGRLSVRATLWKGLASYLALVAGGSLGREGSIVQFGASAGAAIGARLGVDPKRTRALAAAGTAAGFAAAYNTPLAAVLFVVEIVTGLATFELVLPIVVAAMISTAITRAVVGGGPIYGARTFALASSTELAAYLALGALAGALGPAFLAALSWAERAAQSRPLPRPLRGALGGLGVGLIACALPEVTGNGYEAIQRILDARVPVALFGVLLVAKALATVSSVSSGSPGGVFTPSLFLGASLGALVGAGVRSLPWAFGHDVAIGGYALVGMAALTAATTHAPLMAAVLVFELSGDYAIVLPLLLTTVTATLVARELRRDSVYTEELRRRGVTWGGSLAERLARAVRARDILEMDPPRVAPTAPLDEALAMLERGRARQVYVEGETSVRVVDLHAARQVWADRARGEPEARVATVGDVAVEVPTVAPDDTLLTLSERLWDVEWGELPVVEPASPGRVVGVITRRAVLGAFDRELLQRDALLTRVVWSEGGGESADYLELPRGHRVEVVAPPSAVLGRPLDLTEIHRRFQVIPLAVRRVDHHALAWIDPDEAAQLRDGDRLLVVGSPDAIARFRAA